MIKKADVRNTRHTAPESVKKVKSIKQILVKNKMEAERLSQCWQKTLPKKFKPSWMPVKNGVLWWPELPPNAFVAFNLQKNDLPTIFVCYFLHVRSSVTYEWESIEDRTFLFCQLDQNVFPGVCRVSISISVQDGHYLYSRISWPDCIDNSHHFMSVNQKTQEKLITSEDPGQSARICHWWWKYLPWPQDHLPTRRLPIKKVANLTGCEANLVLSEVSFLILRMLCPVSAQLGLLRLAKCQPGQTGLTKL